MKPIIKKIKKILKISTASALLGATLFAGVVAYSNIKFSDYAPDSQVDAIAQSLNCDTSYLTKRDGHYCRMQHNGDEPIYVYFDETLTELDEELATKSLDYVFGVIGDINENYRYEIVDKAVYDAKENKSRIKYIVGNPTTKYGDLDIEVNGTAESILNKQTKLTNKRLTDDFLITMDELEENYTYEGRLYTYIHELLHLVGFADVHTLESMKTTDKFYGNTIMLSDNSGDVDIITPNDYKALLSLLTEKLGEEELTERIGDYKQKVVQYEKDYYKFYVKKVAENSGATQRLQEGDLCFEGRLRRIMLDNSETVTYYEVSIVGNNYNLKIFNEKNMLIDEASGDVVRYNGVAVLKNVCLKNGIDPTSDEEFYEGGYINNLSIVQYDKYFELYDVCTNFGIRLNAVELENDLTL